MEGLALSPDGARAVIVEGYASDHGLLAGSVDRDRSRDRRDHRPVAGPGDGRARLMVRRRLALVREHRRHRQRMRPRLAGRPARGALARRRVHRRRDHDAGLRDHRGRRRRLDHPPGARRRARARALRPRRARGAAHVVQRPHRRGPGVPRRPHDQVDGRGRRRDRGCADDAARRRRPAADDRLRARRTHVELGLLLLRLRAQRGAPGIGRLRLPHAEPARQHRARPRVRAGRDRRRRRHRLPRHHGRRRPRRRRRIRRPRPARDQRSVLRRLHGGVGGRARPTGSRLGRDVGGVELRVVPSHLGGVVVRPRDPGRRLVRPVEPVRRPLTDHARAPRARRPR